MDIKSRIDGAAERIRNIYDFSPQIGLVLGNGLEDYAETLENPVIINYADIPGFPVSSVAGHKSRFVLGERFGKKIIAMQGRFHFLRGLFPAGADDPDQGHAPARGKKAADHQRRGRGEHRLVLRRADVDHRPYRYSGSNPLIGPNLEEFGPRFPDMSEVYDQTLREKLVKEAEIAGIRIEQGVYIMFGGPSYETRRKSA